MPKVRWSRPQNTFSRRFAAWASTTPRSKSTARKCRSWTAAPRRFVDAIDHAGVIELAAPRRFIEVLKPVRVVIGESFGELRPYADGFRADVEINFAHPQIGRQALTFELCPPASAATSAARAPSAAWKTRRSSGAPATRAALRLKTRSSSTTNALLNPEGLRFADEFVRHKVLDVVGDLALTGLPLLGGYHSVRRGHKLNNAVLRALLADRSAWRIVDAEPARRRRGHAEVGRGVVAAFRPRPIGPEVS